MARARDPNRDNAFEMWKQTGGEIKLKEIADQLGVSEGTVRGWKAKDRWDERLNGTLQSTERNAPKNTERSKPKKTKVELPRHTEIENDQLTDKQRLFVMEYLRDFNATRAAMAVGYSKKTAYSIGWELLRKPEIQAEIKRQTEAMVDDLGMSVQRIIAEYMKIAFADISDVVDFGRKKVPLRDKKGNIVEDPHSGEPLTISMNYIDLKDSDHIDTSVISEIKEGKDGISVKLHDKMKALAALEKYLGYMTEEQRLRIEKLKLEIGKLQGSSAEDKGIVIQINYGDGQP
ncbi:phage portal protein [Brevibacillus sp. SYP-B805]|uniref:terminase small subunit n=1 Tax=Brevibacillus sp. SYP-B805 TaxID=1578199 RepID=UPI0013EB1312|nr:terminase small subunit [Brevibacillus sp. SYP-B805]NGQ95023.1 phage portal protein [Brevibacillus sp. SYP-B805]